jgi:cell division protein FtsL
MLRYQDKTAALEKHDDLEKSMEMFDVDELKIAEKLRKIEERGKAFANPNVVSSRRGNWFFWTLLAACILTAVVFYVNGKIQLNDTNRNFSATQYQLDEAKRENSRLKTQLESMATPSIVEEYAAQAGLIREQVSQVTHISLNVESVIEVAPPSDNDLLGTINNWFRNMLEFLGFQ